MRDIDKSCETSFARNTSAVFEANRFFARGRPTTETRGSSMFNQHRNNQQEIIMPPKKRLMPLAGENLGKLFKRQSASVAGDDRSSSTATKPELAEAMHTASTDSDTSSGNDTAVNDNDCENGAATATRLLLRLTQRSTLKFQQKWWAVYGQWLHYDDKRIMYCDICRQLKFMTQNLVTTPLCNGLSAEHCDKLMHMMIQGETSLTLSNFDFIDAVKDWRAA